MANVPSNIATAKRALDNAETSALAMTEAFLTRIDALDPHLHAFTHIASDAALAQARKADDLFNSGKARPPLCGIPVAIKDIIDVEGMPTSHGSPGFRHDEVHQDAGVVARLRKAGAVILGKLTTGEFATAQHPDMPLPVNPWGDDLWSGLSSNGSGVAVASELCVAALGTDTGGSIRMPASANGIVGLKPSHGRVPLSGVFPLAPELDCVGPMTHSVADARLLFSSIADPRPWSASDFPYRMRVGLDRKWVESDVASEVVRGIEAAADAIMRMGGEIVPIQMPDFASLSHWPAAMAATAAYAHRENYPIHEDLYGPMLRAILEKGRKLSAIDLLAIHDARGHYSRALDAVFESVDAVLAPVDPAGAITQSALIALLTDTDAGNAFGRFVAPANQAGVPALAMPVKLDDNGLPISVQIISRRHADDMLLEFGIRLEAEIGFSSCPDNRIRMSRQENSWRR